jgi:hypothetical protein
MDMSQSEMTPVSEQQATQKTGIGSYISDVLLSMMFPITVLYHGTKYLIKGEHLKGILLFVIVAIELIVAFSVLEF